MRLPSLQPSPPTGNNRPLSGGVLRCLIPTFIISLSFRTDLTGRQRSYYDPTLKKRKRGSSRLAGR